MKKLLTLVGVVALTGSAVSALSSTIKFENHHNDVTLASYSIDEFSNNELLTDDFFELIITQIKYEKSWTSSYKKDVLNSVLEAKKVAEQTENNDLEYDKWTSKMQQNYNQLSKKNQSWNNGSISNWDEQNLINNNPFTKMVSFAAKQTLSKTKQNKSSTFVGTLPDKPNYPNNPEFPGFIGGKTKWLVPQYASSKIDVQIIMHSNYEKISQLKESKAKIQQAKQEALVTKKVIKKMSTILWATSWISWANFALAIIADKLVKNTTNAYNELVTKEKKLNQKLPEYINAYNQMVNVIEDKDFKNSSWERIKDDLILIKDIFWKVEGVIRDFLTGELISRIANQLTNGLGWLYDLADALGNLLISLVKFLDALSNLISSGTTSDFDLNNPWTYRL